MKVSRGWRVKDRVWSKCEAPIRGKMFSCNFNDPIYRKYVQLDDNVWRATSSVVRVLCNEQLLNL